jgi:glc operon protein GlcG
MPTLREKTMNTRKRILQVSLLAGAAIGLLGIGAHAAEQGEPRPAALTYSGPVPEEFTIDPEMGSRFGVHDHITISFDVALRLASICEAFAREAGASATIVILDPYGRTVLEHRMDGQSYLNQTAAGMKARTALLTREPSRTIASRSFNDLSFQIRASQYGLTQMMGGYPIIVNDQIIGAIGVGGGAGGEEDCARHALTEVFGPQPPQIPPPEGAADRSNAVFQPARD